MAEGLVAELLIEWQSLEIEGITVRVIAPTFARFRFGGEHKAPSRVAPSKHLWVAEPVDEHPVPMGKAAGKENHFPRILRRDTGLVVLQ